MMNDTRFREAVVLQIRVEALPVKRRFLAPAIEPLKDQPSGHLVESLNSAAITTDAIVLIVASELGLQRRPPILQLRSASYLPEPNIQLLTRLAKFLRTGLATQCRITFATPAPIMGKAQKVEGMGLVVLPVRPASLLSV